ncbi:MAG: hypothetical protein ACXWC6_08880 [Ramlibacter sp.]
MPRDKPDAPRDPENKRLSGSSSRATQRTAAAWGPRRGRSGYGMESIRPHLRAQLEQQKLLHPTFPPDPDNRLNDADED